MASWQKRIDLLDLWLDGSVKEISASIAKQLKEMDLSFLDSHQELKTQATQLAKLFGELSNKPRPTTQQFDKLMTLLWDWADSPLDKHWNGKKVCWVATGM